MYCRYCGKELPEDFGFCPNCGAKQKEYAFNCENRVVEFIKKHKKLSYTYIVWMLIHFSLLLFSHPKGYSKTRFGKRGDPYDLSDRFYPFNKTISDIVSGEDYRISLNNVDVYDISEFFFYTILVPIIIWGLFKSWPCILYFFRINQWHTRISKMSQLSRIKKYNSSNSAVVNESINDINLSSQITEINDMKSTIGFEQKGNIPLDSDKAEQLEDLNSSLQENRIDEQTNIAPQTMSLLRRFIGTLIDKFLILAIFGVGAFTISPFVAPERLGIYIGISDASPKVYEQVDKNMIERYNSGEYKPHSSKEYQDCVRSHSNSPHLGSTREIDLSITFIFILLNLIYYTFFESLLSASPGKSIMGGVIIDGSNNKIDFKKASFRGFIGGMLMIGTYLVFHLMFSLSNIVVVLVFFLSMDLPVLFKKMSPLDNWTDTLYVKEALVS